MSRRILIVDDEPAALDVLCASLEAEGCTVIVATTGRVALRAAHRSRPDLIVLDVGLPEMDGFATCRLLMADPVTTAMPIVFLSALEETDVADRCRAAGGIDFIPKRLPWSEVLERIRVHLVRRHDPGVRAIEP